MTWVVDRPEPHKAVVRVDLPPVAGSLDYLVNALNRAVARRRTTESEDTENMP